MDGETLLRNYCDELGIDFDSTFFYKCSEVALHPGKRIQQPYNSASIHEKDYIVRYYPDNDTYIVWFHFRGRNSCSFAVPADYVITPGKIRRDNKRVGNDRNSTEPVYSFLSRDTKVFLEKIVLGKNN